MVRMGYETEIDTERKGTPEGRAAVFSIAGGPGRDFDIVVTNAGGPPTGDFRDWEREAWIRALDAATAALDNKFAEDKAKVIFQPDVPEYFHYILDGVEPEMKERRDIAKIMNLLTVLQEQMTLAPDAKPAKAGVEAIRKTTLELIKAALAPVES